MSTTYNMRGQRYLRKYTAPKLTPSYASSSEAATIASSLCDVKWTKVANVNPCFPIHPGNAETEEIDQGNVTTRNYFDAALFCADHDDTIKAHRAYANAACYRFTLPNLASGESVRVLESLSVAVNCDPYAGSGARIAVFTNDTGEIPMDCQKCRNGSQYSDTDPSKQSHVSGSTLWSSTNTHVEGAAPRTTGDDGYWYSGSGTAVISPTGGLTVGKYIFVFVLLENYNFSRNGFLEGSAFIQPTVSATFTNAIPGWTTESYNDTTSDHSKTFDLFGTGSVPSLMTDKRALVVYECPRCGVDNPKRDVYNRPTGAAQQPAVAWRATSPSTSQMTFANVTNISIPNALVYARLIKLTSPSQSYSGGLIATYNPSSAPEDTSVVPGVSFYAATQQRTSVDPTSSFDITTLIVSGSQSNIPPNALRILKSGDSSVRIFFVGRSFQATLSGSANVGSGYALVVADDNEAYVVGFLYRGYGSYDTGTSVATGWSFYCLASDHKVGTKGVLTVTSTGSQFLEQGVDYTVSDNIISFTSTTMMNSMLFYTWVASSNEDVTVIAASSGSSIGCRGFVTGVSASSSGTIMGRTSNTSIVVSGDLVQVGSLACSRVAIVDMNSPDQPEQAPLVQIPEYDGVLQSVDPTEGFTVFPVPTSSMVTRVGYSAVVSAPGGATVGGSRMYSFSVTGTEVAALPSPLTGPIRNVIFDNCGYVFSSYTTPNSVRYSSTPIDNLLMEDSQSAASLGIRNCFRKVYSGDIVSVQMVKSVRPKVNFFLKSTSRTIPISSDFGLTYENKTFPLWRISASVVLIPFSLPIDFSPTKLRMAWDTLSHATSGSVLNAWIDLSGARTDYSTGINYSEILPAKVTTSGTWTFLGSASATGTSCEFAFPETDSRVGTLLLSAWTSQDGINPGSSGTVPAGVGQLDVDPMSGVVSGESDGWFPSVTLIG